MCDKINNWKPEVGQKVVCIQGYKSLVHRLSIKEGDVFIVLDVVQCPICGEWNIGFLECPYRFDFICHTTVHGHRGFWHASSDRFAPVPEAYADATAEILENFKPCEGGTADTKIKKLEPQTN